MHNRRKPHSLQCDQCQLPRGFNFRSTFKYHFAASHNLQIQTTREDASTEGDLINFDEDDVSHGAPSSQTDYRSELQSLIIDPIDTKITCELSPATPNYEARFEEDLDEAIRRSLKDLELNQISNQFCITKEQGFDVIDQEQLLSDNEDLEDMVHKSVEKVTEWDAGDDNPVTSNGIKEYHKQIDDAHQWEPKATPKTLKNRELLPKSSFLAFESVASPGKGQGRMKGQKSAFNEPVTRTLNQEIGTMTVSSLRQKRRDRRNQRSYYDITPELQYLR